MSAWAEADHSKHCFENGMAHTGPSRRNFTPCARWHLIGLEAGLSVAGVALHSQATGSASPWHADAVATAWRELAAG